MTIPDHPLPCVVASSTFVLRFESEPVDRRAELLLALVAAVASSSFARHFEIETEGLWVPAIPRALSSFYSVIEAVHREADHPCVAASSSFERHSETVIAGQQRHFASAPVLEPPRRLVESVASCYPLDCAY